MADPCGCANCGRPLATDAQWHERVRGVEPSTPVCWLDHPQTCRNPKSEATRLREALAAADRLVAGLDDGRLTRAQAMSVDDYLAARAAVDGEKP